MQSQPAQPDPVFSDPLDGGLPGPFDNGLGPVIDPDAYTQQPAAEQLGSLSVDTVLSPYVTVFCVAFAAAYVFTPIMRHVAITFNIVDRPDGDRKLQKKPVAYLGGVAVFLGFIAALAVGQFVAENHNPAVKKFLTIPIPILASACVIFGIGLIDDIKGMSPKLKIIGQVAAAVTLLAYGIGTGEGGFANQFVTYFFERLDVITGLDVPVNVEIFFATLVNWGLVVALVVFCCNASNLMDGLDGLCGGVTAIIALGLVFVCVYLAKTGPVERAEMDAVRLVLAIALFGAVLGFLPFNFNPASIFMGDTGSLFLGFTVAVIIVLLGEVGGKWMLGGLVMFSLPVLDTALAFTRRWLKGRPLFSADRHHFHHQLMGRTNSVKWAVVIAYGLSIFFVVSGCLLVFLRTRYALAFYLVLFGCIIVAAYKMGMIHERGGQRERQASAEDVPLPGDDAGVPQSPPVVEQGADKADEPEKLGESLQTPADSAQLKPTPRVDPSPV
ncbi:MAG: MraY family glycosyltransferase [Planctomycetota bacterium]